MWRRQEEPKPSSPAPDAVLSAPRPAVERPSAPPQPRSEQSRVSRTVAFKGEISGREDLFIDGEVQGNIRLTEADLTVGPNGRVTAEIEAREVVVEGQVQGNIRGRERVTLRRTASVTGEVITHRIVVEEGAIVRGSVDILRPDEARTPTKSREVVRAAAAGAESLPAVPIEAKEQIK